jgi:hypothetical protein
LRHEESRAHVDVEDEIEILARDVDKRRRPVGPGIVDQNVEGLAAGNECIDVVELGDIENARLRLTAALTNSARGRIDLVVRARAERDVRAGIGKRGRCGKTDAATGAGDERAFPLKPSAAVAYAILRPP